METRISYVENSTIVLQDKIFLPAIMVVTLSLCILIETRVSVLIMPDITNTLIDYCSKLLGHGKVHPCNFISQIKIAHFLLIYLPVELEA